MYKYFFSFLALSIMLFSCDNSSKPEISVAFTELNTKCSASLRGLHVVDENIIWASGTGGTVLLSTNSGATWKENKISGAEKNDFRSIHAWDENNALVFGVSGPEFAYKTKDGGENWEPVFRDTTSGLFFNSLKFADSNNGLAVSDPVDGRFYVLRTKNGGQNWERVLNLPEVKTGEANFAASNTCIEFLPGGEAWIASGGMAARIFYSSDFGKSWDVVNTPMIRGLSSSGIFSVSFKNKNEGVIVGGVYDQPELNTNIAAYTFDGGKSWLPAMTMPKEYRSCVQQLENNHISFVFAIGKTGCDVSFDNGINWHFLADTGLYTFRPLKGKVLGFAAGANGRIAKVHFSRK